MDGWAVVLQRKKLPWHPQGLFAASCPASPFSASFLTEHPLGFLTVLPQDTTSLEAPRLAVTNEPSDASLSTGSPSRRRGQKTASLARSSNYLVHRPREGLCPGPGVRSCLPGRLPSRHSYIYLAPGQISAHTGTDLKLYLESAQPSLPPSPLHGSCQLLFGLVQHPYFLSHMPHTTWSQHGAAAILLLQTPLLASRLPPSEIFCHGLQGHLWPSLLEPS